MTDINKRRLKPIERIILKTFEEYERKGEEYVPLLELERRTKLSERQVKWYIKRLRVEFAIPIITRRKGGYFMPKNEEEREHGLLVYEQQIKTELDVFKAMKTSDLNAWRDLLEKEQENEHEYSSIGREINTRC